VPTTLPDLQSGEPYIRKILTKAHTTYVLLSDNSLWGWGAEVHEEYYLFNQPQSEEPSYPPQLLLEDVRDIGFHASKSAYLGYIIKTDGSLWTWGREGFINGELYKVMDSVVSAAVSSFGGDNEFFRSLALTADGNLWGWRVYEPEKEPILHLGNVVAALCGGHQFLALKSDGSVWAWGWNWEGQVGNGSRADQNIPLQVLDPSYEIVEIFLDTGCSFARSKDGTLWGWGALGDFRLVDEAGSPIENSFVPRRLPTGIRYLQRHVVPDESADPMDACFILYDNGELWSRGINNYGQLGREALPYTEDYGLVMANVESFDYGHYHVAALTTEGELFTWGSNTYAQLGTGKLSQSLGWVKIMDSVRDVAVVARTFHVGDRDGPHVLAVDENDALWAWGDNQRGQVGNGSLQLATMPQRIMDNVAKVAAGREISFAVQNDGSFWRCGMNDPGPGYEENPYFTTPTRVMDGVRDVFACGNFHMVLKDDGTLWGKGHSRSGLVGESSPPGFAIPIMEQVYGYNYLLDQVKDVSIGLSHCLVIRDDDSLWGWGSNWTNQLGTSDIEEINYTDWLPGREPLPIQLMEGVVSIAAGGDSGSGGSIGHSLVVTEAGELYGWGYNYYKQVESSARGLVPPVLLGQGYSQVAAGMWDSAAIDRKGTLRIWGNGFGLQYGDDWLLAKVEEVSKVFLSPGTYYIIKEDGSLWGWGSNGCAQLGIGTYRANPVPYKVPLPFEE